MIWQKQNKNALLNENYMLLTFAEKINIRVVLKYKHTILEKVRMSRGY